MRTRRILPPRLSSGDTVALLSPASPPERIGLLRQGKACLESLGLRVRLGPAAMHRHGYLAGSDEARAGDLRRAFEAPEIKAVFCTRGGYGISRLLEKFDPCVGLEHPKIVVGFSDITTLHLAFQAAGLVTFWGPMPCVFSGLSAFSTKALKRALMSAQPLGVLERFDPRSRPVLRQGLAEGQLTGGTLTLLASSLGTAYEVQTQGRIIFLEDAGEEPYKIDRLLTHLLAAGKLADAAGIVLGTFTDDAPRNFTARHSLALTEVLADRLLPLRIPVVRGLAVGHLRDQWTLPYGVRARLNTRNLSFEILESGVK